MMMQTGTTKLTTMGVVFTENENEKPKLLKGKNDDEPNHEYESDPPSH